MTCHCDVGMCTHRPDCRLGQRRRLEPLEYTRAVYEGKAVARDPVTTRSKGDKIARLRKRLDTVQWNGSRDALVGVLKGILDLLDDEL